MEYMKMYIYRKSKCKHDLHYAYVYKNSGLGPDRAGFHNYDPGFGRVGIKFIFKVRAGLG